MQFSEIARAQIGAKARGPPWFVLPRGLFLAVVVLFFVADVKAKLLELLAEFRVVPKRGVYPRISAQNFQRTLLRALPRGLFLFAVAFPL